MKTIQTKPNNFQEFYASEFVTLVSFAVTVEIFVLVMFIFGGAR